MPLFNVSRLSKTDISSVFVTEANNGILRLRSRLIDEIVLNPLPRPLLRNMVQAFFQGHTRRGLMLIEGGYEAYLADRGLVGYVCTRAVYETVACVFDFCDQLTDHLDRDDYEKTMYFLDARIYAARMQGFVSKEDGFDNTAINIVTQIERVSKHFPGMKEEYEYLSEKTHPNGLGALHHFWHEGEADEVIRFSNGGENANVLRMLVSAGRLLAYMEKGMCLMESKLQNAYRSP
jgi:hypothetical protein